MQLIQLACEFVSTLEVWNICFALRMREVNRCRHGFDCEQAACLLRTAA